MTEGMARVVVGRYRLVRPLGRGGMGAVWQAHDTLLGRDVAIKEMWLPSAGEESIDPADPLIRRVLREAQAAARLRHPGIVTVHDVVTDKGRPWIVMELINGGSLAQAIQDHGLLPERQTAEIGLHVLDALRVAHREGIAHRDVKPANILLDTDRVVLTDFGIAAIDDATALTATGQMVGSPAYLAPERINGRPATAAADLWALGVTLYAAVTGRSPFQRDDTQATFAAILTSRPAVPAHAGKLWPVIKGLLVKDPDHRLTAEQARTLLANVAYPSGSPGSATPAPGRRRPGWWPAPSKRRWSTPDDMPGTLVAPPLTIAAPTAYQNPQGDGGPASPGPATPEPIAEAPREPATVARTAAAQPDDTVRAASAGTTVVPGQATGAETVSAESGTIAAVAAGTTAESAVAGAVAAKMTAGSAAADTLAAGTVEPAGATAESAGAEVVAAGTTAGSATADAVAGATVESGPAGRAAAAVPEFVIALPRLPVLQPGAAEHPTQRPEAAFRPGAARARTVWLAALAVAALLIAGGFLRIAWPGSDDGRATGRQSTAGGSPALVAGGSVKPAASASHSASAAANLTLDPCLVGTWRMTSMQVVNHDFEGVDDVRFTSPGGLIARIWPDGKEIDDYTKLAPMTATIKGVRYAEVLRGVTKSHNETRNGKLYSSELSGGLTYKMTRNGKPKSIDVSASASYEFTYICTETRLTTYGNEKVSTQSYQRISHTP